MAKIKLRGPFAACMQSLAALNRIAIKTYVRHAMGKKLDPTWDANTEIGTLFWRRQFSQAMRAADMNQGRKILDCLQTPTRFAYEVDTSIKSEPAGTWYISKHRKTQATILYFHGGGYTFHGAMSKRFAAMLAHHTGASLFAPEYRLTPEHPHPAQAQDALAAWRYIMQSHKPEHVVVIGDSAGGHMALMLLQSLKAAGFGQPALAVALCPWTDIGDRGRSLHANDPYDLVQGWMALQFGKWLDPDGKGGRENLSPIFQDFYGLAPIYMQVGGNDILHDMVHEFAIDQAANGSDIMLDVWPNMMHDFQLMDALRPESAEALLRIEQSIRHCVDLGVRFIPTHNTRLVSGQHFLDKA